MADSSNFEQDSGVKITGMPLNFRVWSKELKKYIQYRDIYDSSYDQSKKELKIVDIAHYFYNTDDQLTNVDISQDTGLEDKNGKAIFPTALLSGLR